MQQCRADRIGIKPEARDDLGDRDRVRNVRFAAHAELPGMHLVRVEKRLLDFLQIVLFSGADERVNQVRDRLKLLGQLNRVFRNVLRGHIRSVYFTWDRVLCRQFSQILARRVDRVDVRNVGLSLRLHVR